jgi:hypothetical protein
MDPSALKPNYQSLSVKDLLETRDLYHYHLMNEANVVGTAIGLYLIRDSDPPPAKVRAESASLPAKPKGERNFHNSGVATRLSD